MEKRDETFHFTYSAQQQTEVEDIRKKYLPPEENKMEQLRKLDAQPGQKAMACSIAIGTLGALILGSGMSLIMTEFGAVLGELAMILGIIVGVVGLIMVGLAYPAYNYVLKKERRRIAPEILKLTEELMH